MKNYCAFLRGVNVGGRTMKMAEVCKVFSDAGMQNVRSVLASGNILFISDKNHLQLKTVLEKHLKTHYGEPVYLFLKEDCEVEKMAKNCPFDSDERFHNYIFISEDKFAETLQKTFDSFEQREAEQGITVGGIFYWQVPKGNTLSSQFGKILGRKSFRDRFTSRNINTFDKIITKFKS